jgi:hypothetical protein
MQFLPSLLLFLAPLTLASPISVPEGSTGLQERQCFVTCGSTCYSSSQVSAARNAGANYVEEGDTAGSSSYPHVYNNYEGFDFLVSGPYYEFPILASGETYNGGEHPMAVI